MMPGYKRCSPADSQVIPIKRQPIIIYSPPQTSAFINPRLDHIQLTDSKFFFKFRSQFEL